MRIRSIIFLLLLLFCVSAVNGQNNRAVEKVKEAIINYRAREYTRALDLLKTASSIDSIYADPYYWMGKVYLKQKNVDLAKKYAKKAFGLNRHEEKFSTLLSVIDLQKAVQAAKQNELDRAISIADGIIQNNEKFVEGYLFKVELFIKNGKYSEALSVIEKVQKLAERRAVGVDDDTYVTLACQKALILFRQEKYERAIIQINRWNKRHSSNDKVKEIYKLVCSDQNPYYKNLNNGKKAFKAKDYEMAKKYFTKAKEYAVSGETKKYISKIDNILKAKKLFSEAQKLFDSKKYNEAILKIGDANQYHQLSEAVDLMRIAERKLDEKADIERHGTGITIDPEKRRKKNAQKYFKIAIAKFRGKQYLQAKDYIERVLTVYPTNKNALKLKSRIEENLQNAVSVVTEFKEGVDAYKGGNWKVAIQKLKASRGKNQLSENPEVSNIPMYLAHCYFEIGDYEKAKQMSLANLGAIEDQDDKLNAILAYVYYFESGDEPASQFQKYFNALGRAKHPFAKKIAGKIKAAEEKLAEEKASSEKMFFTYVGIGLCLLIVIGFVVKNVVADMLAKKKVVEGRKDDELDSFVSAKKGKSPVLTGDMKKRLKLAKTLYEKAAYEKAIENLQGILEFDPDNKNALLIAGMSFIKTDNYSAENMQIFEKLTKLFPDNCDVLKGLCECYISANKFTPTLFKSIKKVLEKEPGNERLKQILEERG